jgi:beta-fructofuranosidase
MLVLEDRWVWDWWFVEAEGTFHIFYLQAPRSLGDPDLRHDNASIGHAASSDLRHWTVLPDAIERGQPGAFDELATWTGCVVANGDRWTMFYTGLSSPLRQEIGAADSSDLTTWHKRTDNPILASGGPWYAPTDGNASPPTAWRDPWVYATEQGFEMLITASDPSARGEHRGVIGRASSPDLATWRLEPPLVTASDFAELEVPQLIELDGSPVVIFSCGPGGLSTRRRREPNSGGTYYLVLDGDPTSSASAVPFAVPELYACRVIKAADGEQYALGFVNRDERGRFPGVLSDPVSLRRAMPGLFAGG